MNRCNASKLHPALFSGFALYLLACICSAAWGQTVGRPIPQKAQIAQMVVTQPPNVLLNDLPDRLSPGARIRGPDNLLVLSGALVGKTHLVRYQREPNGQIHEVWILNESESQSPVGRNP
ncbi:MAG: hypothetical protein K9K38_17870 [Rhodoferax sp.]|nr:hypothetical protein [Rhodoferax sp.]MCF8211246.1 hypothetical protein [Rhodoferax sp.]